MRPPMVQGAPDDFQTPPEGISPLLPHLDKRWTIWEPAAGMGWMADALQEAGHPVIATDKYYKGSSYGHDFLEWSPDRSLYDCIVTNPPYSLKQQFLVRCMELGKPFALLLPLTTFETMKRQTVMKELGMDVLLLPKRINFRTPSGAGSGSWFSTAWFTWGLQGFNGKDMTARCYVEWDNHD